MTDIEPTLTYRPFTQEELAGLPEGSIVAMTWPTDPDPELFRRSEQRYSQWALLTGSPQDFDFERWTHSQVFSEHALYAVVYRPV